MNKNTKKYIGILFSAAILTGGIFWSLKAAAQGLITHEDITESGDAQCQISANKGVTVDINRIAECMENRYGYDKNIIRRSKKKEAAPSVEVHFSNTDPVEGEEVTAMAVPSYFKNDISDLYYTWYIVHYDENGNPKNTIREGRREAMGIAARGKFDPCLFGTDIDCNGTYDVPDTDDDGYVAQFGGDGGVGAKSGDSVGSYDDTDSVLFDKPKQIVRTDAITRCYRHNFGNKSMNGDDSESGRDQIIECEHHFPPYPGVVTGDGIYNLHEEEIWLTNPQNPDTDGDGVRDEADLAGLNQREFTFTYREGDQVGVWVEGTSMIPIVEGGQEWETIVVAWDSILGRFETYSEAYAACEELLVDSVDMGSASASGRGGSASGSGSEGSSSASASGGSASATIDLEAELDDRNKGDSLYDSCVESIKEYTETEEVDDDGDLNAYYKIMWASPGTNGEGFYHGATVPVDEKGKEILEPEVDFRPKNPQYEQANPAESDLITVTAGIGNEEVDDAFLFYDWKIWLCADNDPFECEENVTDLMKFETFTGGLGVKKIVFRPESPAIFERSYSRNRAWLKASVVVSQDEEYVGDSRLDPDQNYFPIGAYDHVMIPVLRNDMQIKLFRAVGGEGTWTKGQEICADGLYRDVCPLYPNEVLAAEVIAPTGSNVFAWQLNDQDIPRPVDCRFSDGCNGYSSVVFFTVDGAQKSLGSIGVTAKRNQENELISQRMFSVYNPLAVLNSTNGVAQPTVKFDGTPAEDIFEAPLGSRVSFRVEELVPSYLSFDEVDIQWYLNGEQVYDGNILRPEYLENHNYTNASVSGDSRVIEFDLNENFGSGYKVTAKIIRVVPQEEQDILYDSWRILDTYTLTQDRTVSVKVAFDESGGSGSLKQFFASSFANAPEYLIFVIRLAIAMVLMWSVFFGMTYAVSLNRK